MKLHRWRFLELGALLALGLLLAGCPARMTDVEKHSKDGADYMKKGSYAKAEEAFDRAIELSPGGAGLLMNRANARMLQENYDDALADYDAALATDPEFAKGYANRGILRDHMGDTPGAIADYRRALELDPKLAKGPSIWKRIIGNPSTDTISGRMHYLLSLQEGEPAAPAQR